MERVKPGRDRIKSSLFTLIGETSLNDISIIDLCERAKVSRTTFYTYYSNVDDVYRDLVRDLMISTSTMRTQLRCQGCESNSGKEPLCKLIRKGGPYYNLTNESRFLDTFIDVSIAEFEKESFYSYDDVCATKEQAYALYCFQMMGCIGAARIIPDDVDWELARDVLDQFIRGGLNSVRHAKPRPSKLTKNGNIHD